MKLILVCVAAGLSVSCASSVLGQRNFLENTMQPDVVAKTLSAVQGEWKAQVAIFADCDTTAKLPGSPIVNCKDAQGSFDKSCGTITNAIVQGSGGDKDVMHEYMGDVCKQRAMSGWHQLQCNAVTLAIGKSLSADKYQNRVSFNSGKLCTTLWTQLLGDRAQEVAKEQAERQAAEKKAAEEAAEEEKSRVEAQKKEEERKKAEEVEHEKQEAAAKAAEAKAKAAEAAAEAKAKAVEAKAKAEEKKAEAEAVALAANQKMTEVAAAEKKQEAAAKAVVSVAKPEANKKVVKVVKKDAVAEKPAMKETAAKVVAATVPKVLIMAPASPAPAAAGAPAAPAAVVNLNDKMPLKAAEQGFTGKAVKHSDGKTAAADWQKEYATKAASFIMAPASPAPAAAGAPGAPAAVVNLNDPMPLKAAEQGFTGKAVKHTDGKTAASDWQKEYATKH